MGASDGIRAITARFGDGEGAGARYTLALRGAVEHLLADPQRYGFMQAVRLIERWQVRNTGLPPQDLMLQRLRFRNSLSMAFPPSEIAEFRTLTRRDGKVLAAIDGADPARIERIEITPAFMGLLGMGGALPAFYTELFAQREQMQRDHSARRFLDVFTHRAVALFYEAWRKHRTPLRFEAEQLRAARPAAGVYEPAREAVGQMLALAGFGQPALRRRLRAAEGGVSDLTLAHYAGLLRQRPVSAGVIAQVLAGYFGVPVRMEQFVGRWFALPVEHQSSLGLGACALGGGAVVGERVWQRDLRLRLHFGPLSRAAFDRFLPGGPALLALRELLTLLTGVSVEYEVRLTLRAADVAPARLGAQAGPRLGWDGFLITRPCAADRSDAGYDLHALA
jgi:type VI secretion system protein ImpH